MEGKLHRYWPERKLNAFEYAKPPQAGGLKEDNPNTITSNILLFIAGLGDSFLSVPYVLEIARRLQHNREWTVVEVQLASSNAGWGTSNLDADVEGIAECVRHLQQEFGSGGETKEVRPKIVIMGHSTGSQDVLHYLHHYDSSPSAEPSRRPAVQGAILQAPVSDREAILMVMEDASTPERQRLAARKAYERCLALCTQQGLAATEENDAPLPMSLTEAAGFPSAPLSKERFWSLTSPDSPDKPSADDLFSSDLSDERLRETFGVVGSRGLLRGVGNNKPSMLILISGADEHMPSKIDKEALLARWKAAIEAGPAEVVLDANSSVVKGGRHNLGGNAEEQKRARAEGVERVVQYLKAIQPPISEV